MRAPSPKCTVVFILTIAILQFLYFSIRFSNINWSYVPVSSLNRIYILPPEYETKHTIVVYNLGYWMDIDHYNLVLSQCSFNNCRLTLDKTNLSTQSAIMFSAAQGVPETPPISSPNRNPDQVWICSWIEPPFKLPWYGLHFRNMHWRGTINWTQSYMLNAELYYPYGAIRKRIHTPSVKNYTEMFQRKTKMAAWAVSNCHTPSQRMRFVKELQDQGIEVDIYGRCGGKMIENRNMREIINQDYKFYLAFENGFCTDYITEKLFSYFQLDVIVIVRGAGNYTRFLPSETFVNSMDFKSVKGLADHLKAVASNEELFTGYMKLKDRYESIQQGYMRDESFCNMCEKLNNVNKYRHIYHDYGKYFDNCFYPPDIHQFNISAHP